MKTLNNKVKTIRGRISSLLILLFLIMGMGILTPLHACELCESQQPAMWKGITHGPGPEGNMDHLITWSAVLLVGVTLFLSIKFLVRPKEDRPGHIKNMVVEK